MCVCVCVRACVRGSLMITCIIMCVCTCRYEKGNFIAPTILTDVKTHMKCYTEEIFGPVLVALNADTLDDVRGDREGEGTGGGRGPGRRMEYLWAAR